MDGKYSSENIAIYQRCTFGGVFLSLSININYISNGFMYFSCVAINTKLVQAFSTSVGSIDK